MDTRSVQMCRGKTQKKSKLGTHRLSIRPIGKSPLLPSHVSSLRKVRRPDRRMRELLYGKSRENISAWNTLLDGLPSYKQELKLERSEGCTINKSISRERTYVLETTLNRDQKNCATETILCVPLNEKPSAEPAENCEEILPETKEKPAPHNFKLSLFQKGQKSNLELSLLEDGIKPLPSPGNFETPTIVTGSKFSCFNNSDSFIEHETMMNLDSTVQNGIANVSTIADYVAKLNATKRAPGSSLGNIVEENDVETDAMEKNSKVPQTSHTNDGDEILNLVNGALARQTEIEKQVLETKKHFEMNVIFMRNRLQENVNQIQQQKENLENIKLAVETLQKKAFAIPPIETLSVAKTPKPETKRMFSKMRSDMTFLRTPRRTLTKTPNVLTPHSMSFCIQNQLEKLLEKETPY